MTRIVTVSNQKGGVGKTTTTVNMAAALAQAGFRILVIDLDPQGNASTALGIAHQSGTPSIYEVLLEDLPLADAIQPCPDIARLECCPATVDLAGAEVELVAVTEREYRLRSAIDAFLASCTAAGDPVDFVLIDCPPSLGLLTINGLSAAGEVLLPIQCEYYALEGLSQLLHTIQMVAEHLNPTLAVSAILLTMYDGRTRLAAQVAEEVRTHFGGQVLDTIIPRNVRISEAPSYGQTVLTYEPSSAGALTYRQAAAQFAQLLPPGFPQT